MDFKSMAQARECQVNGGVQGTGGFHLTQRKE